MGRRSTIGTLVTLKTAPQYYRVEVGALQQECGLIITLNTNTLQIYHICVTHVQNHFLPKHFSPIIDKKSMWYLKNNILAGFVANYSLRAVFFEFMKGVILAKNLFNAKYVNSGRLVLSGYKLIKNGNMKIGQKTRFVKYVEKVSFYDTSSKSI